MGMNEPELEGAALDAAVAQIEGLEVVYRDGQPVFEVEFDPDIVCSEHDLQEWKCWIHFRPSSSWDDGGPLIEREKIGMQPMGVENRPLDDYWAAECRGFRGVGLTPLLAAMRAFVAAHRA